MNKSKVLGALATIIALILVQASVVHAAPVYIDTLADFPAYPYNTAGYMVGGDYVGCGPTTGAMIMGYFEHHFGATGLLTPPTPSDVDEGEATAWQLNSYMNTIGHEDPPNNGYGYTTDIKPGLENYAAARGYEVEVLAHAPPGEDPATSWYNDYGAYGVAWIDDANFWVGGTIDADLFCDWAEPKLTAGVAIFLTIDTFGNMDEYGDHWVPCVGVDKAASVYYWFNTYDTSTHSSTIQHCSEGIYGINFVRTVEFIPEEEPEPTDPVAIIWESAEEVEVDEPIDFDASGSYDPDGGAIVSYAWDFGDGSTSTDVATSHAYSSEGQYTVTLVVTDDEGDQDTATATKFVYNEIEPAIPEVPFGTIVISASMIIALGAYFAMPRLRRKSEYIHK